MRITPLHFRASERQLYLHVGLARLSVFGQEGGLRQGRDTRVFELFQNDLLTNTVCSSGRYDRILLAPNYINRFHVFNFHCKLWTTAAHFPHRLFDKKAFPPQAVYASLVYLRHNRTQGLRGAVHLRRAVGLRQLCTGRPMAR